jgi:lysozyme family protein
MEKNWERVVGWTLQEEGAGVRSDRGQLTRFGVTGDMLARARMQEYAVREELEELERDEAARILRREWDYNRLDSYPTGLDYFVFDCSLFCGRNVSIGWLGCVLSLPDTYRGDQPDLVVDKVQGLKPEDSLLLIEKLAFMRRRRHKSQPGGVRLMPVWTNRVTRVQKKAKQLLLGEVERLPLEAVACHGG